MTLWHHEDSLKELHETRSAHELTLESDEAARALGELGELLADASAQLDEAMLALAELGELIAG